jgi:BirA family biotin operon repressor/biotin-[acetyl-CoA-carboxylase] ligase
VTYSSASVLGIPLRHFEEIDSTNEEARRLALAGVGGPLWLVADRQTKGRGRRGRNWQSPQGNLAATLLLSPAMPIAQCAQLSFVAALGASDAVGRCAPRAEMKVKWPNDVLADEKKIAGILLESTSKDGARPDWLAIGFGINLASHPADTEFPATSIAGLGEKSPAPHAALDCLAASWSKWYEVWSERGFEPIRDAWLARAARLGAGIRARVADIEVVGMFEGIDADGALNLRESTGRMRRISAGEVFF